MFSIFACDGVSMGAYGPPSMTVSLVNPGVPRSCCGIAQESKTAPRIPDVRGAYPLRGRGMRYPKPGGWIGRGVGGKTRLITVTEEDGLVVRCGSGVSLVRFLRFGREMAETTCEAFSISLFASLS